MGWTVPAGGEFPVSHALKEKLRSIWRECPHYELPSGPDSRRWFSLGDHQIAVCTKMFMTVLFMTTKAETTYISFNRGFIK